MHARAVVIIGAVINPMELRKDKPPAYACANTKDGRVYFHLSLATTLRKSKVVFLLIAALLLGALLLSPTLLGQNNALKRRVRELETRLGKRVHWLMQHREHLQEHIKTAWTPRRHEDGRLHLLSPPDGLSRLAEALAPNTEMAEFDDHYMCGAVPASEADTIKKKVALAAVSWRAPLSLRNSMESWRAGGLLDIVDERMLFLNAPTDEDRAIAAEFDFDVYTTGTVDAPQFSCFVRSGGGVRLGLTCPAHGAWFTSLAPQSAIGSLSHNATSGVPAQMSITATLWPDQV